MKIFSSLAVTFLFLIFFCHLSFAGEQNTITIAIPVSESTLIKSDPYFVYLKRAYNAVDIPVKFIVLPGERSFKMLKKGRVSGSYPRFKVLSDASPILINTPNFEIPHSIYAFSSLPFETDSDIQSLLINNNQKIGTVRGTKILEPIIKDFNLRVFNHVDHLVGAFQAGNITIILEREEVVSRYFSSFKNLHRSNQPIVSGLATQILHINHKELNEKLSDYFRRNPIY